MKTLIQAGADVNQTNKVKFTCALSYLLSPSTSQYPCVKHLILMIFILQNDWSSIIIALDKGHLDVHVVKKLIEAGANVNHA